jgi:RNA polymerase sigma-70 factor (ECF subfamily)
MTRAAAATEAHDLAGSIPRPGEDEATVAAIAARDESALRAVMSAYAEDVHGMARRVLRDPSLAEEVTQDVFVSLWRRPESYASSRGSLRNYLLTIARNKAVDAVRRSEARDRARSKLEPPSPHVDVEVARLEDRDVLDRLLDRLSVRQRQAVELAYFGGLTYREVATALGIPEGTAKTRLHDALLSMRRHLVAV